MVETESNGDLIGIKVRGKDPKKITAIANAWGEAYERYVNELYGQKPQSPENIRAQVAEARETYQKAEEALVKFLGNNQIDALTREIKAKKDALSDYYATKRQLDCLIADARALRDHLREGASSSATADDFSILLLRASAFTLLSPGLPAQLQLSLEQEGGTRSSAEERIRDLDALIAVLEARREEVQSLIGKGALQQEILQLEEQLEREEAKKRELTQARDLAWDTYQTLARKEAEVQVATQVRDTEVRFAVPAAEPKEPVAPKRKLNIAVAGVLGLMVGVFGAFLAEYMEGWESEGK